MSWPFLPKPTNPVFDSCSHSYLSNLKSNIRKSRWPEKKTNETLIFTIQNSTKKLPRHSLTRLHQQLPYIPCTKKTVPTSKMSGRFFGLFLFGKLLWIGYVVAISQGPGETTIIPKPET